MKQYCVDVDNLKPIAVGLGACYATDEIVVKGRPIGFMYREAPDAEADSGWRFLAGDEDQAYMDDPENLGVYDINMIANIDAAFVTRLVAPIGAAFERDEHTGRFEKADFDLPDA